MISLRKFLIFNTFSGKLKTNIPNTKNKNLFSKVLIEYNLVVLSPKYPGNNRYISIKLCIIYAKESIIKYNPIIDINGTNMLCVSLLPIISSVPRRSIHIIFAILFEKHIDNIEIAITEITDSYVIMSDLADCEDNNIAAIPVTMNQIAKRRITNSVTRFLVIRSPE